jgi:hypothetical protein
MFLFFQTNQHFKKWLNYTYNHSFSTINLLYPNYRPKINIVFQINYKKEHKFTCLIFIHFVENKIEN